MTISREELATLLDSHRDNIKEHIDLKLEPITNTLDDHEIILRGKSKTNGVVSEVQKIKTTGRNFKWVAGFGGGLGFLSAVAKFFDHGQ